MNPLQPLSADRLYTPCDTARFAFATTAEWMWASRLAR
jgi:hypothetical protein